MSRHIEHRTISSLRAQARRRRAYGPPEGGPYKHIATPIA